MYSMPNGVQDQEAEEEGSGGESGEEHSEAEEDEESDESTGDEEVDSPPHRESDINDPDLGAAAMEADAEGGGGGGGFRPSATFADWPDDDAEGEVVPRRQPRVGQPGASSSAGLDGQGGTKRRRAGPSLLGGRSKKFKGAAAATKREKAVAKANRFRKEVKKPPLVSA